MSEVAFPGKLVGATFPMQGKIQSGSGEMNNGSQ